MDLNGYKLDNLPCFYKRLFKVWGFFHKERLKNCDSLFWLLKEPVVYGSRLRCAAEPTLLQRMCEARVLTLGQVVEVCGPHLDNAAGLASRLGIRSVRVVSLLLRSWKQQLTYSELSLTAAYCDGLIQPDVHDPLPDVKIVPIFNVMVFC